MKCVINLYITEKGVFFRIPQMTDGFFFQLNSSPVCWKIEFMIQ